MFDNLPDQLYKALIVNDRWMMYLEGLGMTLLIAVGAMLVGAILGTVIAVIKVSAKNGRIQAIWKPLRWICDIYITVIRGTPVMVQILIAYLIIFASAKNDMSWAVAVFAFGLNSAAYVAEIIRAGIQAVDKGQEEAGRSLGLSSRQTMIQIIMPQAIKNILPALGNELIVLFKETAIVGYIAVEDLTKVAFFIQSRTFQPLVPLLLVALIYLAIVMLMTWALGKFERRLARSDSR